jgi:hypothetical protein
MRLAVHCRCAVERTIDTDEVGPWRLRCKKCQEIIYDPAARPRERDLEPEGSTAAETQFHKWLQGSGELKVLASSAGDRMSPLPSCPAHPRFKIVAACNRCSKLLCKRCLDRVGDSFTCAACVEQQLASPSEEGGLLGRLRRLLGGGR